jgi:Skp family chaperone for outer membrane proteins
MRRCGNGTRLRIFGFKSFGVLIMNRNRFLAAFTFIATIAVPTTFAQGPGAQPKPQAPPVRQTSTAAVPVSKVAVIFSEAFQDPKTGIARFNVTMNKLNGEFADRQKRIDDMAAKIKQLPDEITNLQQQAAKGTPIAPQTIQAKIDQLDQLKKQGQRETEDAQAAYEKRRQELFGPLQDDVGKALDKFAKDRGITMVLDGSQVQGILYAADGLDVTKAFISDYNSKNPATAAVTPSK